MYDLAPATASAPAGSTMVRVSSKMSLIAPQISSLLTVTISETAGFLSVLCPSPVAAPVQYRLSAKQKLSATAPVYRGPCGMSSNVNGVLVQGINAWQGHNLLVTVTNNATGAVLSSSPFSWQDILNPGL